VLIWQVLRLNWWTREWTEERGSPLGALDGGGLSRRWPPQSWGEEGWLGRKKKKNRSWKEGWRRKKEWEPDGLMKERVNWRTEWITSAKRALPRCFLATRHWHPSCCSLLHGIFGYWLAWRIQFRGSKWPQDLARLECHHLLAVERVAPKTDTRDRHRVLTLECRSWESWSYFILDSG